MGNPAADTLTINYSLFSVNHPMQGSIWGFQSTNWLPNHKSGPTWPNNVKHKNHVLLWWGAQQLSQNCFPSTNVAQFGQKEIAQKNHAYTWAAPTGKRGCVRALTAGWPFYIISFAAHKLDDYQKLSSRFGGQFLANDTLSIAVMSQKTQNKALGNENTCCDCQKYPLWCLRWGEISIKTCVQTPRINIPGKSEIWYRQTFTILTM